MAISHNKILRQISKQPMSLNEIQKATGLSKSGIRGRISELRKDGYNIQLLAGDVKKYFLKENEPSIKEKILLLFAKRKLFDKPVEIKYISRILDVPKETLEKGLIEMNKDNRLIQLTNNKIIIKE